MDANNENFMKVQQPSLSDQGLEVVFASGLVVFCFTVM